MSARGTGCTQWTLQNSIRFLDSIRFPSNCVVQWRRGQNSNPFQNRTGTRRTHWSNMSTGTRDDHDGDLDPSCHHADPMRTQRRTHGHHVHVRSSSRSSRPSSRPSRSRHSRWRTRSPCTVRDQGSGGGQPRQDFRPPPERRLLNRDMKTISEPDLEPWSISGVPEK